jgi:hypothetical protein
MSEGGFTMGDIGPVRKEITFEPLPDDVPVEAPAPEPSKEPAEVPA